MTESTLSADIIINDIQDNDISIVLGKLTFLSKKSSSNSNNDSKNLFNNAADIFETHNNFGY